MPILYTSDIFGGDATISVATFANLPLTGKENQRVCITGESTLFDTSYPVIVCWNVANSVWQLEEAATTYLKIAAAEFNSGIWIGTSSSIGTKANAIVRDTTYNDCWVWNSTNNIFVPNSIGLTAIQNQKRIKGDSATLEAGWNISLGANCTGVSTGGKLILTATSLGSGGPTLTSQLATANFTDASQTNSTNFYMKCMMKGTVTRVTTGAANSFIQYQSATGGTGNQVEFGMSTSSTGTDNIQGKFMDRVANWGTLYTATANRGDTLTTETLVQFRTVGTGIAQVKVGSGGWHDIAKSTCRVSSANYFYIGAGSNNNPGNVGVLELRYLQAIRYT